VANLYVGPSTDIQHSRIEPALFFHVYDIDGIFTPESIENGTGIKIQNELVRIGGVYDEGGVYEQNKYIIDQYFLEENIDNDIEVGIFYEDGNVKILVAREKKDLFDAYVRNPANGIADDIEYEGVLTIPLGPVIQVGGFGL